MKSKELALAESIVDLTNTMDINHHGVLPKFKTLINQYNELAQLIKDPDSIPPVSEFNPEEDVHLFMDVKKISNQGKEKFYLISTKCKQYIKQHSSEEHKTEIIPTSSEKGWNKERVIAIVGIIIATVIGIAAIACVISYNQGANSKEKELYDERENLKLEKVELQNSNSNLSDSIITLNQSLDTLRNLKLLKESLNDSILSLSKQNKLYVDSIKRQNHKIDSLDKYLKHPKK